MHWITDKYPEPGKNVLIYDLIEGIVIGYHDLWCGSKYFFSTSNSPLSSVACWKELPNKPDVHSTIQANISKKEMIVKVKTVNEEQTREEEIRNEHR